MGNEIGEDRQGRQRITVTGVVQGVGFRPFVYGLALSHHLGGFVGNNSQGVFIEIEGEVESLVAFRQELAGNPPPLAHIETIVVEDISPTGETTFKIVRSLDKSLANTLISPDICICDDCYSELLDPANRRYEYPFINCTNCGPRFSIIRDIPYDRPFTTMADFVMCADCQEEYDNPLDRRFHAQPNACAKCGPHVWLEYVGQNQEIQRSFRVDASASGAAIAKTRRLLAEGKIIAVKGLGGFHLACNAMNDDALSVLRERKGRIDKPFAVMALDVETVRRFAELSDVEEAFLCSKERPILLLRKKKNNPLSTLIAPGNQYIGVMLPYTPLHYLLLQENAASGGDGQDLSNEGLGQEDPFRMDEVLGDRATMPVLVMTSGNHSDEPIVRDNEEARERLAQLADAFLFHNRAIHARCDDSVVRVVPGLSADLGKAAQSGPHGKKEQAGNLMPIRRSRGYAPFPVKLPFESPSVLAVGGELKATFCLAKGHYGYMSQHIGDMENLETLEAFEEAVAHFQKLFRVQPRMVVCDKHPLYLSSRWAKERRDELPVVSVQHHHAHIASVMAENQLDGSSPVIGFSFDGTGYGTDGAVWGGEVLIADYKGFERASYLKYVPLVGGDAAVKRPYRLALSHLRAAGVMWDKRIPSVQVCSNEELQVLEKQIEMKINSVPTSSMGRLFDAIASIAGVRQTVTYEAQAAIEFESLARPESYGGYQFEVGDGVFDAGPVVKDVVEDMLRGVDPGVISARFHQAVADLILRISNRLRNQTGLSTVALSGGVFQNVTLLRRSVALLKNEGFLVVYHRLVPPNDGGIALGQVAVAVQGEHRFRQ